MSERTSASGPSVLLTTEGTYPHYLGGVSTWADFLVRELPDVDFVVWSLMMNPFIKSQFHFPRSVSQFIGVPLWGVEQPAEYTRDIPAARVFESSRRTHDRDIETHFLPIFESFLGSVSTALFSPSAFATSLVDMHHYFRQWDYRTTWRSPLVWEMFTHFLIGQSTNGEAPRAVIEEEPYIPRWRDVGDNLRFLARGRVGDDAVDDGAIDEDIPTVAEATEGLRLLYRLLQTLNVEVPPTDVTHSAAAAFCAIPCILAKLERGTPFLLTEHGVYLREQYLAIERREVPFNLKRLLIDMISAVSQTAYVLADQVSPVCRFNGRWEMAYGVPENRMKVIYNGVSPDVFRPMEVERSSAPTVVQLARVDPLKDQMTFLRVADAVRRQIPDVRFLHYGPVVDDKYADEVRSLYERLRLERTVSFMGSTDDPNKAINQGDVVLLTSISEAFPFSVVEALMCGKPVVSTAVGGVSEALEGTGATAPPHDAEGLAQLVIDFLRLSEEERRRIGTVARQHALDSFTLERFIGEYRQSYYDLAAAGPQTVELAPAATVPPREEARPAAVPTAPPAPQARPLRPVPTPPEAGVPGGAEAEPDPEVPRREPALTPHPPAPPSRQPDEPAAVTPPAPAEPARPEREAPAPGAPERVLEPAAAATAVGERGTLEAALLRAVHDDATGVRRAAVEGLGRLGGIRAMRVLAERVTADPSAEVREAAISALVPLVSPGGTG